MIGVNTVAAVFSSFAYSCDEFQADRLTKCNFEARCRYLVKDILCLEQNEFVAFDNISRLP